jgi:glycosyltransferase involved in cell wall biosynthesis
VVEPGTPTVSVTIPTKDSARTLRGTLESLLHQNYQDFEIVIIDGGSRDSTLSIAQEYRCRILSERGPLLAARVRGIREARGRFTLLLDSDQRLEPATLASAVGLMDNFDMLLLIERPVDVSTITGRLFDAGRSLVQSDPARFAVPEAGLVMPRFFRAELLRSAAAHIPPAALDFVTDRDHQILYFECSRISRRLGALPDALRHVEPSSPVEVVQKAVHWGYGAGRLRASHLYDQLFSRLIGLRLPSGGLSSGSVGAERFIRANALAAVKAIPYGVGFAWGWLNHPRGTRAS